MTDDGEKAAAEKKRNQESFERSLAGPSVGKAGGWGLDVLTAGLARDQTGRWLYRPR